MDLGTHIDSFSGFYDLSEAERIRFFVYFVHSTGRVVFEQADVTACYRTASISRPEIGAYLRKMVDRGELIKTRAGYQIDRRALDALTAKYGQRAALVKLDQALDALTAKITNTYERVFFDEMMICVRHGAFRSAVVMAWNLAYTHVCDHVFANRLVDFNAQLPKSYPRAEVTAIVNRDDFAELKESQVVQVCRSAGIITGDVDKILKEKLARRNSAAHPSSVTISQLRAEETIVDLVENVVLKI